jgi:hypothetical protein
MKSNFKKVIYFLVFILTVAGLSCTKDDSYPGHENFFKVGTDQLVNLQTGIIIDSGLVSDGVRHMHVALIDKGYILDPGTGEITGTGSEVNFGYYSDEDGKLPTGTYVFSDSKDPFTFNTGFITEAYNFANGTGHLHTVVEGIVIVYQDGSVYDFTFNCLLNTGSKLIGTFKGDMIYFDADI